MPEDTSSPEPAADAPAEAPERNPSDPDNAESFKDEAIQRRLEHAPFRDAFDGFTSEEQGAILEMVTELRDDPGAGSIRMRNIAHSMAVAAEVDFLKDAPWDAPAPDPNAAPDPQTTLMPKGITEDRVRELQREENEGFQKAQMQEELGRRIEAKALTLGYTKFDADGSLNVHYDILMRVANRGEHEGDGSVENKLELGHAWLSENGPGSVPQPSGNEHPRTVGEPPAAAQGVGAEPEPTPWDMNEAHKRAQARIDKAWTEDELAANT